MKKILCSIFAASLMLLGTSAYAQLAVGAGYVNSKQTLKTSQTTFSAPTNGFYAGLEYNVPVGDFFGLSAGVNFEYLMSKNYSLSVVSGDFKEQYINLPCISTSASPWLTVSVCSRLPVRPSAMPCPAKCLSAA